MAGDIVKDWIRLVTAENPVEAGFVHGLLESAGIEARLQRMELWTAAVEIYFAAGARPSVWVHRDQAEQAREVLRRQHEASTEPAWTCPGCGERLGGQFTACWQCGRARPESE